jgi:hypothetical protein
MIDTIETALPICAPAVEIPVVPAVPPSVEVIEPALSNPKKTRQRGRPAKYKTADAAKAARQKKDRARKHRQKLATAPKTDSVEDWDVHLKSIGLGMDRGIVMTDAPSNAKGLLVTGGLSSAGCAPNGPQMDLTAPPLITLKKKPGLTRRR